MSVRGGRGAEVWATIVFETSDPDISDPSPALADVLSLLLRLKPQWLDFAVTFETDAVTVRLGIGFEVGGAGKIELLSLALAKAEGDAGYRVGFTARPPETSEWVLALGFMEDACLPGGEPLAAPLTLGDGVGDILRRLRLADAAFGYRLTAQRAAPAPDVARGLAPALASCSARNADPLGIEDHLRQALQEVCADGWTAREGLCLRDDAPDAVAELIDELTVGTFRRRLSFVPVAFFGVDWQPFDRLQSANALSCDDWRGEIAARRTLDYPERIMLSVLETARRQSNRPRPPPSSLAPPSPLAPRPVRPSGPFAFISYARRDLPDVGPIMHALPARGLATWFDGQIDPTAAWDEHIERSIRTCDLLIAFVSPAYEASRYCRREIKFADGLRKPILPVAVRQYVWGPGLEFMFQELQVMPLRESDRPGEVINLAARLAPSLAETASRWAR